MKKVKKIFKIIIFAILPIIVSSKFLYAAEISFNYDTSEDYKSSIDRLRKLISDPSKHVDGLRIIPEEPKEKLTIVKIKNEYGEMISLVLHNDNLYIIGFISGNFFYRFNDSEFSGINIPGYNSVVLPIGSNYRSLVSEAHVGDLSQIRIGRHLLDDSIFKLSNYHNVRNTRNMAHSILRLIVFISEGTRFSHISREIERHIPNYSEFTLGISNSLLIRNWGSLSEYGNTLEYSPHASSDYHDENTGVSLTRSTLSSEVAVVLHCKLSSFSNTRITLETNIICPPDTERENVLINNTYWPKIVLVNVFD